MAHQEAKAESGRHPRKTQRGHGSKGAQCHSHGSLLGFRGPPVHLQGDLQAPVPSLVLYTRPFHEALPTPQPQGPVLRQLPPPVRL